MGNNVLLEEKSCFLNYTLGHFYNSLHHTAKDPKPNFSDQWYLDGNYITNYI